MERRLHFSGEHSVCQTIVGFKKAIGFFGHAPKAIQTDNGPEFAGKGMTKRKNSTLAKDWPSPLDSFCAKLSIVRKRIELRVPECNGKVERSRRIDRGKFHRRPPFHPLSGLARQGAR